MTRTELNKGWVFSQVASESQPDVKEKWAPCSKFPTAVHVELQKAGVIPDPYKGMNEWEVQWIAETDWTFKTKFTANDTDLSAPCTNLVFEGLDTYCTILVNGEQLGTTSNMFLSHRLSVAGKLKPGKDANTLELRFAAPLLAAKAEESAHGGPMTLWNGDSSRLYSRKAQYGWGWDWGPIIMSVGPWKTVWLESYEFRLDNLHVEADLVGKAYSDATLKVHNLDVLPHRPESGYKLAISLLDKDQNIVKQEVVEPEGSAHTICDWQLGRDVEFWWPIHYGDQPLYSLEVALLDSNGKELACTRQRVAFRHVEVVQEPLEGQEGTSFLFEVNGVRIFCGGSNWIPADNHLTEITPERYRAWIDLMISGNQNMVRVWGGGIYEHEALYDVCDEKGVLVWQDFMFGCGLYPSYDTLNASIKEEAEQVVTRLRTHPSVVIFSGNNEDYQVAETEGVVDYDDNSGDYMHTKFPGRHIYEVLLPEVVGRLSNIFYWRSSPYGGKTSGDQTVGDCHQWNVWHGTQEPWTEWDALAARFVSEFGMHGYPHHLTVDSWFASDEERKTQNFPQSRITQQHNKATGGERRLDLYLVENMRYALDMPSFIYDSQMVQSECLSAAYRLWRRNWRGRGKEYTAGALVWQINDCWPCISWAIADYYLRPKPSFYSIARELRPYTVGMARKESKIIQSPGSLARYTIEHTLELWGCNSTLQPKQATVKLHAYDLEKGTVEKRSLSTTLAPNSSTEIWSGPLFGQAVRTSEAEIPRPIVVGAVLIDNGTGDVLSRYASWPEPYKFLTFPSDNGLEVHVKGDQVQLRTKVPIKGLVLDVEHEGEQAVTWSDQAIDLMPDDPQSVEARGLAGRKITYRHMGDGHA